MTDSSNDGSRLDCDIAIVGSAIASTLLGTILASRGLKVVLIEKDHHPKFAIGESTIPQTSLMLQILAKRYGIPEFDHLSSFEAITTNITPAVGKKSNFGFIFHKPGLAHGLDACHQLGVARQNCSESHLYRQDIDTYLLITAIRYGCQVHQRNDVVDVEIADNGVTISTNRNKTVRARCLVDGTGYDSFLARKLALRETPPSIAVQSRTMFVHMVNVRPFDSCVANDESRLGKLAPWHQGTLHHIFRDGWMWVIPFDNHPDSINPICSVGLQLDPRSRPKPAGVDPFDEFRSLIADYPELCRQFENAKPIREWVSSGRLQYSSDRVVGDRWCLLSHSAGFVDPLFSRGLSNTVEVVSLTASTLLAAAARDDFSRERLVPIEALQRSTIAGNDALVHGAYISFRDFDLWNAWFRIWGLTQVYGVSRLLRCMAAFDETGPKAFERLDAPARPGALTPDHPEIADLIERAYRAIAAVETGELSAQQAETRIFDIIASAHDLPPIFPFADRAVHLGRSSAETQLAVDGWLSRQMQAD
jgi:tetracycline 7-halogenase / FADH2 O2-dependent halogenase